MLRFTPTFFNNNFFMDETDDGDYVYYSEIEKKDNEIKHLKGVEK